MIVKLHSDSVFAEDHLVPPCKEGAGDTYLEFMSPMPADDLVEIMGESLRWHIVRTRTLLHQLLTATLFPSFSVTFILMTALRARMYWLSGFVYGRENMSLHQGLKLHAGPLQKLRRQAKQSLATFRTLLRRSS